MAAMKFLDWQWIGPLEKIKVAQRDLWIYSAIFVDILSIFTHISSMSDLLYLLTTNLVAIFSGKNIAILPTHIVEI